MGGYIGCCLLANCPARWSTMAIGGWNPQGVLPKFVAGILARTYQQPWMDSERDTAALQQACTACCNPVPNLEEALTKSSSNEEGYPKVLLWAGESDMVVKAIRSSAKKFGFPLITCPGSHEHVNMYAAGIQQIRDGILEFLKTNHQPVEKVFESRQENNRNSVPSNSRSSQASDEVCL